MKEKILKHLQKALDEINSVLDEATNSNTTVSNIDLENMESQLNEMISELEDIDEIEMDNEWDATLSGGLDDEDDLFDDFDDY